ncbi:MAG: hypothetical protein PGN25_21440 [Methylorubrum populi]
MAERPAILFVCLGNICRPPLAEVAFRWEAERIGLDVTVDSAGTGGWHADYAFGSVAIENVWSADWPVFRGERRLLCRSGAPTSEPGPEGARRRRAIHDRARHRASAAHHTWGPGSAVRPRMTAVVG